MIDGVQVDIFHALSRVLRERSFRLRLPKPATQVRSPQQIIYRRNPTVHEASKDKAKRIKRELLEAGATFYGLLKSESRIVPKLLHSYEHIEAVIYGQHHSSSAMLVATDERIIYVDKKPMALFLDEVSYEVISGIEFDIHLFSATIVLHTPVRNYDFRFVNLRCAENFARHIEKHRLERESKNHEPTAELLPPGTSLRKVEPANLNDLAGYYWLPVDEEERQKIQAPVA